MQRRTAAVSIRLSQTVDETFQDPLGVTVKTGYRGIVWHGLKLDNVLIAL